MTSAPVRDRLAHHLLTPENVALLLIDYQPSQLAGVPLDGSRAPRQERRFDGQDHQDLWGPGRALDHQRRLRPRRRIAAHRVRQRQPAGPARVEGGTCDPRHRGPEDRQRRRSNHLAGASAASKVRGSWPPRWTTPSMNRVGVPSTWPEARPLSTSRRIRSATAMLARSWSNAPTSRPIWAAYPRRSPSSSAFCRWNSISCMSQNRPCTAAASDAAAAARSCGWMLVSGKCRNANRKLPSSSCSTCSIAWNACREYGHSESPYSMIRRPAGEPRT